MATKQAKAKSKERVFLTLFPLLTFFIVQTGYLPAVSASPELSEGISTDIILSPEGAKDLEGEFTFIDYQTKSFATYSGETFLDVPIRVGRIDERDEVLHFIPTREILDWGGLYVLKDPRNADFLFVTEKLPEGGFGRLLRYRGEVLGESVDLEFLYDDGDGRVTILDYGKGKFFRTSFSEKPRDPLSVLPGEEETGKVELVATPSSSLKFVGSKARRVPAALPEVYGFHTQIERLSDQDLWMNRLVRGPPVGGLIR